MADQEIKYNVVKNPSIVAAMDASDVSTKAAHKMKMNNGTAWDNTVIIALERLDSSVIDLDISKDGIENVRTEIVSILANHILSETEIPEKGKGRNGKDDITIMKKDGSYKWSTWSRTKVIFGYAGDIAKILQFGHMDILYPETNKVAPRCDTIQLCKVEQTPMDNIKRLSGELQDNLDQVSEATDILTSHQLVSALAVNNLDLNIEIEATLNKLDSLLAVCDDVELAEARNKLAMIVTTRLAA